MTNLTLADAKAAKRRAERELQQRQRRQTLDQSPYVDAEQQRIRPETTASRIEDQYLSVRAGTNLRKETVTVKGRATTWEDAVDAFEDYVWRQQKAAETWDEEKGVTPTSHRFTEKASKDRYARTLGVDRAARKLWGDDLVTIHVVRRARPFGVNGQPQPPADHLNDLLAGNRNVFKSYKRHIRDSHELTYARLSVLEPHGNGYAHIHDGLWVHDPDGVLGETDIYPAIDAHLRAVDQAQPRHHGSSAVSVKRDPEAKEYDADPRGVPVASALPRELTKFLGGLAPHDGNTERQPHIPNVLQAERGPLRFYALLWARGIRQWRPDRRGAFKHLVKASQEWWDHDSDTDNSGTEKTTYPEPEDITVDSDSEAPRVDIDARPIDFEPFEAEGPPE